MSATLAAVLIFAATFGAALAGMGLRALLPSHHVQAESQAAINAAIGLVAAMTALVLGLVIASAQSAYSDADGELKRTAVHVLALDRALARYGPETQPIRAELRQVVEARYAAVWPERASGMTVQQAVGRDPAAVERVADRIRNLPTTTETQRSAQARALGLTDQLLEARWALLAESDAGIPRAFVLAVVAWLVGTFLSFGLFAPRNVTVVATLAFAAFAVSSALFLVLELNAPMSGLVKISGEPLRQALDLLGR
jgi:hypothetical protein